MDGCRNEGSTRLDIKARFRSEREGELRSPLEWRAVPCERERNTGKGGLFAPPEVLVDDITDHLARRCRGAARRCPHESGPARYEDSVS